MAQHLPVAPAWRTDVHAAIGGAPLGSVWGGRQEYKGRPITSLWFTDNNTIVASFVTRDSSARPQVSRRDNLDSALALRLRAIFLDTNTGRVTAATNWPTESRRSLIVAAHDGRIVAQRGNELTLYDSDRNPLRTAKLPSPQGGNWYSHSSPTGKNILFYSRESEKSPLIWVESDTLKILGSWEDASSGFISISDKEVATATCLLGRRLAIRNGVTTPPPSAQDDCEPTIMVREISTDWRSIAPSEPKSYLQFVNENTLFVSGITKRRLVRTDGQVLFAESNEHRLGWGFGCWGTRVLVSSAGQRFVIPGCEAKGAVASLDIGGHSVLKRIILYDMRSEVRSCTLDIKGPKIQDEMQFAVSPDGSKLAILNKGFVEVFQLPPAE